MVLAHRLQWSQELLAIVKAHLSRVEDVVAPQIPPVYAAETTIFSFFEANRERLCASMQEEDEIDPTTTHVCIHLMIGLLEQSCALSFLHPRERRTITTAASQKERRVLGINYAAKKKRRVEGGSGLRPSFAKFSHTLTLEYLLRLIIALPSILEHYDRLGDWVMPATAQKPLWAFAQHVLKLLDEQPHYFCRLSTYMAL